MSKKRRFRDDSLGSPLSGFNWDLCIFCQSSKKEELESSASLQRVAYDQMNQPNSINLVKTNSVT